jgi:hypothetical protein
VQKGAPLTPPAYRRVRPPRALVRAALGLALTACQGREIGLLAPFEDQFVGSYQTTWGPVLLRERDDELEGAYRRGQLRCIAEGQRLRCLWSQGRASGRATLQRRGDGVLEGTWGRGERDDDGGAWLWVPEPRRE